MVHNLETSFTIDLQDILLSTVQWKGCHHWIFVGPIALDKSGNQISISLISPGKCTFACSKEASHPGTFYQYCAHSFARN